MASMHDARQRLAPNNSVLGCQLGALGNARSTRVQTAALGALSAAVLGGRLRAAEVSPPTLRCARARQHDAIMQSWGHCPEPAFP